MPRLKFLSAIAFVLFLFSASASAQAMMTYLHLEVVDSDQKPVPDAAIETPPLRYDKDNSKKTDQSGLAVFQSMNYQVDPSAFRILKPDYYPFELFGLTTGIFKESSYYARRQLKIELLKIPKNADEEKVVGDQQIKRDFFLAVLNGDAATVGRMLKSGISPNITTGDLRGVPAPKAMPAVAYAAYNADLAVMNEFLAAKIDLSADNPDLRNLLAYYVCDLTRHVSDKTPRTVLNAYFDTLIDAGANLSAIDTAGKTLLTDAAEQNNVELVAKLIGKGADVNAKNRDGSTVLAKLASGIHATPKTDPDKYKIFELLLKSGANPNIVIGNSYNKACEFPLKSLTMYGHLDLAKLFLAHKANPALKCENGQNALNLLTVNDRDLNYPEVANILIDAASDVNGLDEYRPTPLMTAAIYGDISIVKKLLTKGAKINAGDRQGFTPLMFSLLTGARTPDIQLVKLLLQSGADPNSVVRDSFSTDGGTALAIAAGREVTSFPEGKLAVADAIVRLLIANKANVNLTAGDLETPLMRAARAGRVGAVKILTGAHADITARNRSGQTVLNIARICQNRSPQRPEFQEIVKILEAAGAKE